MPNPTPTTLREERQRIADAHRETKLELLNERAENERLKATLSRYKDRESAEIHRRAMCQHVPVPSGYGQVCSVCGLEL